MIGITFALPTESADLRRLLSAARREGDLLFGKIDPPSPRLRRAGNRDIAVLHTGVGRKNCDERIETLLHKSRPRLVISAGFAGAVVDDLQTGELLLAENFSDRTLLTRTEGILRKWRPRVTKLFTSASIIDSVADRNQIARASGASAVDMETGAIADVCRAHGVLLLSLRAISDSPKEPFPAPMSILFDVEKQKTDLRKLFGYIVADPTSIMRLLKFFRQIREARARLTDALVTLIQEF